MSNLRITRSHMLAFEMARAALAHPAVTSVSSYNRVMALEDAEITSDGSGVFMVKFTRYRTRGRVTARCEIKMSEINNRRMQSGTIELFVNGTTWKFSARIVRNSMELTGELVSP